MSKKLKITLIVLVVAGLGMFGCYSYIMKGGARDIQSETADYSVGSDKLTAEFNANAETATKKYLNKAVAISGTLTDVKKDEVTIDSNIICKMQQASEAKRGDVVKLKGRILGFDDLMGEIKLDQCSIIK